MNKCLNCGSEVGNKYCNVGCQNSHRLTLNKEKYDLNPKKCKCCEKPLEHKYRGNTFCSNSCSATINNKGINRVKSIIDLISDETLLKEFNDASSIFDFFIKLGYKNRPNGKNKNDVHERLLSLGKSVYDLKNDVVDINTQTKGKLFSERSNWQNARSSIQKNARKIYNESDKVKHCTVCGYDKHYEVAHIKSVASFSDETLISEINNIDNLIGLCPNHHWEYDNLKPLIT